MLDNVSLDASKNFQQSLKAFTNLLKEFPRNPAEDFIYDDSTLKKITNAGTALDEMGILFNQISTSLEEKERNTVKESLGKLSLLMDEMPRDPADEFLYDRVIHQLVEDARESVLQLTRIFS